VGRQRFTYAEDSYAGERHDRGDVRERKYLQKDVRVEVIQKHLG
jgi:hypothetical protein